MINFVRINRIFSHARGLFIYWICPKICHFRVRNNSFFLAAANPPPIRFVFWKKKKRRKMLPTYVANIKYIFAIYPTALSMLRAFNRNRKSINRNHYANHSILYKYSVALYLPHHVLRVNGRRTHAAAQNYTEFNETQIKFELHYFRSVFEWILICKRITHIWHAQSVTLLLISFVRWHFAQWWSNNKMRGIH